MRIRQYVVVTSTIGGGATTLASHLADDLKWETLLEGQIDTENKFFADAYHNFTRWGFYSQVEFLTRSAERHSNLRDMLDADGPTVVEDRTPFEHTECYLRAYSRLGMLTDRETELLDRLALQMEDRYVVPDLVIFRDTSPDQAADRVRLRNRPNEDQTTTTWLNAVHGAFESFASSWNRSPILRIPETLDALDNQGYADIRSMVLRSLSKGC